MTEDQQEYLEEIRSRLCHKCIDGDGNGNCLISDSEGCGLIKFFPQIIEAVRDIHSSSMEPYESALRKRVCGGCTHQSGDGVCAVRDDVECALDRYFPLIVQMIEELDLRRQFSYPSVQDPRKNNTKSVALQDCSAKLSQTVASIKGGR